MEYSFSPLEGYNAIFAGMIFLSIIYFAIASLTGIGGDHGDAPDGHDMDAGHMDHDIGHDAHAEGDADGHDHDHDHDHDGDNNAGFVDLLSGLLNTEHRCPLTYAVFIMLLIWGAGGYLFNAGILRNTPNIFFTLVAVISHVGTGLIAILITRQVAPIVARSIPTSKGISQTYKDFVGKSAEVSSILDPEKGGMITIDMGSSVTKVRAKLTDYEGPPLKRGTKVLIVAHLSDDLYECVRM